jgi:hypothetical protein
MPSSAFFGQLDMADRIRTSFKRFKTESRLGQKITNDPATIKAIKKGNPPLPGYRDRIAIKGATSGRADDESAAIAPVVADWWEYTQANRITVNNHKAASLMLHIAKAKLVSVKPDDLVGAGYQGTLVPRDQYDLVSEIFAVECALNALDIKTDDLENGDNIQRAKTAIYCLASMGRECRVHSDHRWSRCCSVPPNGMCPVKPKNLEANLRRWLAVLLMSLKS